MKRYWLEIRVAVLIVITVMIVAAAGFMAYRSLKYILSTIKQEAQPNLTLIVLKEIFNDLSDCEKSVQYYNLNGNNNYLRPYYKVISTIDSKINQLYRYNQGNKIREAQIDTITQLIEEKLLIWDKMLALRNDNRINEALNNLQEKLEVSTDTLTMKLAKERIWPKKDSIAKKDIISENENVEHKSNIFKRFFSRRKLPETKAIIDTTQNEDYTIPLFSAKDTTFEVGVDKMVIVDEIMRLQHQEDEAQKIKAQIEISLIKQNAYYSRHFYKLVSHIEKQELIHLSNKAQEADQLVKTTNYWIIVFILTTSILLLSVFYVIQKYIKKSNSYQLALLKAKDEALKLSRTREQFMANMSHEIRTPINAIAGFTDQIIKSQLNGKQKEQISIIKQSTDHLKNIINDILDFSKLEAGKITFEKILFNPREVILEAFVLYKLNAEEKGVEYECNFNSDFPELMVGDPLRLKQILLNLLSNAIKFTPDGIIRLDAFCEILKKDRINLEISVSDTGIGIPQDKVHSIFEEFVQAETDTTRNYGGTGLGLAIVRNLINLQNGTIHVNANLPKGTIFSFSIPYTTGKKVLVEEVKVPCADNFLLVENQRFLIADDDEFNCRLIEQILKKWKTSFTIVHNGLELLEEFSKSEYDVLLVDIRMPMMDGMQVARNIRALKDKTKSNIPLIALTATIAKEELETCKKAGINVILPKPYTEERLFETICEVLRNSGKLTELKALPILEEKPIETKIPMQHDFKNLYHLANNDKVFVKEMLVMFIKTTNQDLMELKSFVTKKDWLQVAESVHKIKSPCKHLDANILAENLQIIEDFLRSNSNGNLIEHEILKMLEPAELQLHELIREVEKYIDNNFAEIS